MRLRTVAAAGMLAAVAPLSVSVPAFAQDDKDCKDFASQQEAQKAYEKNKKDPHNLEWDKDKNDKACENLPSKPAGDTGDTGDQDSTEAPEGSVDAGGGGTASGPADLTLPLSLAAGAALAAGGILVIRRRQTDQDS